MSYNCPVVVAMYVNTFDFICPGSEMSVFDIYQYATGECSSVCGAQSFLSQFTGIYLHSVYM